MALIHTSKQVIPSLFPFIDFPCMCVHQTVVAILDADADTARQVRCFRLHPCVPCARVHVCVRASERARAREGADSAGCRAWDLGLRLY